ncbi:MAG: hypothetical protein LBL75_01565 [Rickettsiales bacterium]|jgi:hypothetical protein|nr:hypothetical protein [Rickettsiales bacterium]
MQTVLQLIPALFVIGCAGNTPSPIDNNVAKTTAVMVCRPIYGTTDDWDKISNTLVRNIYRHNKMCESLK